MFSASDQKFIDVEVKYWMMREAKGTLCPESLHKKTSVPFAIYEPSYPNSTSPRNLADPHGSGVTAGELNPCHPRKCPSAIRVLLYAGRAQSGQQQRFDQR